MRGTFKQPAFFVLGLLLLVCASRAASAHVLLTDGSVGAVLHIEPEEDPIVGVPARFFFEFKDTSGKFDPLHCDCTVSVFENGRTLVAQKLFQGSLANDPTSAVFSYAFPEKGVYSVRVIGKPVAADFQPFTFSYDLRVSREVPRQVAGASRVNHSWHFMLFGAPFILVFTIHGRNAYLAWKKRRVSPPRSAA